MADGFLSRSRTIAGAGFNRWLVPPAALCIHLCIGQAYAFSVFNLPLTKLLGISQSAPGDWKLTDVTWIFSIAIALLGRLRGGVRALGGGRRTAPRDVRGRPVLWLWASSSPRVGVNLHQLWLVFLGYGVLGGCGLGLGYISPVSTLIKWFPDRPGMATGMAIMGFGGGALIASPLSVWLMQRFSTPTHVGVSRDVPGAGRRLFCVHDDRCGPGARAGTGLQTRGAGSPPASSSARQDVYVYDALKTPQFWLLWGVLCMNVTAGIGVLGQASRHEPGDLRRPGHRRRRCRLRRPAESVQHAGPVFLGIDFGSDRTAQHLFLLLHAGNRALRAGAAAPVPSAACRCSSPASPSSSACTAAVSPPSPPTCATCSAPGTWAPSTAC